MSQEPGFVEEYLRRLNHAEGIAAIQVLDVESGALILPEGQPPSEPPAAARDRARAVLRSLTTTGPEAEGASAYEAVPPDWRHRLEGGEYALYQARIGWGKVLEALVYEESQDVADLLDATVEQLERHFAGAGPG